MYQEKATTKIFHVKNFYIRRLLRIWPLYFVSLFIAFVIYPQISAVAGFKETADWRMYVLFLANFDFIYNSLPACGLLNVHWSIAVEEQFYLIWPWVFILAGQRSTFHWFCLALIGLSFSFHFMGGHEFHTLTALNDLAMGALMAYCAFFYLPVVLSVFQKIGKILTFCLYVIGFILLIGHFQILKHFPWYSTLDHFISALFFGFVIMEQNYSPNSFYKFGSIKLFSWLGTISYGIYLLHMVAIYLVLSIHAHFAMPLVINAGLVLVFSVGLSYLSYQYLEKPFLALKGRF